MKKKISVVVPVYFNEGSLPLLFKALEKVEAELQIRKLSLELIFVDDGSQDNSIDLLLEIKAKRPETKVIKLTRNFGALKSSKTGLSFVTGDAFGSPECIRFSYAASKEELTEIGEMPLSSTNFLIFGESS